MKKMFLLFFLTGGLIFGSFPANAATISYDLCPFTGDPLHVSLKIDNDTLGFLTFNLSVDPNVVLPNIGDLRGFFFNIEPFPGTLLPANFNGVSYKSWDAAGNKTSSVLGNMVTQVMIADEGVTNLGGGNVISPGGPFDVGLEFGTAGIGSDDISQITFRMSTLGSIQLSHLQADTDSLGMLFGARATSVGPPGTDRSGSTKISEVGVCPKNRAPAYIPEPATLLLLGSGLIGLAVVRRKFKKS